MPHWHCADGSACLRSGPSSSWPDGPPHRGFPCGTFGVVGGRRWRPVRSAGARGGGPGSHLVYRLILGCPAGCRGGAWWGRRSRPAPTSGTPRAGARSARTWCRRAQRTWASASPWRSAPSSPLLSVLLERESEPAQQRAALVIGAGSSDHGHVHAALAVHLVRVDLVEHQLLGEAE